MNNCDCPKSIFTRKKILINGSLFIVLILLMIYIFLRKNNIYEIVNIILSIDKKYTLIGIFCMFIFIFCEALNIRRSLKIFGYEINNLSCLKYALVGFFFSSITPSATGGQPMQVYYMYKDKISMGHSTIALLMNLASYQFITVALAIIGFIFQHSLISKNLGSVKYLILVGVITNTLGLIIILIGIFSRNLMAKIVDTVVLVLIKFNYKKVGKVKKYLLNNLKEYKESAIYFKKNKLIVIKILITSLIQMIALNSIPFWIYKSFGLNGYSIINVISIQAVLFITVSALPLPGSVGVSESGFMIMYKTLFPTQLLSSAMLLSRGISFYLCLLISGSILTMIYLLSMIKVNKYQNVQKIRNMNKA